MKGDKASATALFSLVFVQLKLIKLFFRFDFHLNCLIYNLFPVLFYLIQTIFAADIIYCPKFRKVNNSKIVSKQIKRRINAEEPNLSILHLNQ